MRPYGVLRIIRPSIIIRASPPVRVWNNPVLNPDGENEIGTEREFRSPERNVTCRSARLDMIAESLSENR